MSKSIDSMSSAELYRLAQEKEREEEKDSLSGRPRGILKVPRWEIIGVYDLLQNIATETDNEHPSTLNEKDIHAVIEKVIMKLNQMTREIVDHKEGTELIWDDYEDAWINEHGEVVVCGRQSDDVEPIK